LLFWEWLAVDLLFQLRPGEPPDRRIVLVGFTSEDFETVGDTRLSDGQLARLLESVKRGQPRAIGLDIFRDRPVEPGHEELMQTFRTTPYLIAIGKQTGIKGDPDYDTIEPPPIPKEQIADVSAILDGDDVQRRGFLYPVTRQGGIPSLGLALAYQYLAAEGIEPVRGQRGGLFDLGPTTFYRFQNNTGPYVRADGRSYQFLLNWRPAPFEMVSVSDVLERRVSPAIFRDRIVLIGGYSPKLGDEFLTPFSRGIVTSPRKMYGMEVQAQVASTILSAVLDGRPLVKVWHEPWISLWVVFWASLALAAIERAGRRWGRGLLWLTVGSAGLCALSYFAFWQADWLPLVPPLAAIWTLGPTFLLVNYEQGRRRDWQEIRVLNEKLQQKLDQRQIYRDLAVLTNQLSQTLSSPLQYLLNSPTLLVRYEEQLSQLLQQYMGDERGRQEANTMLAKLAASLHTQAERLEFVCFKLAQTLPHLESLLPLPPSENFPWGEVLSLSQAFSQAIDCIRPLVFEEYGIDLRETVALNLVGGGHLTVSLDKLTVLLNRIVDEVLFQSQLAGESFPAIEISSQVGANDACVEIEIGRSYPPKDLTLYFCQDLLAADGGQVSVASSRHQTQWCLRLPQPPPG
jgi:CHASE2 domain-containing sensor protein